MAQFNIIGDLTSTLFPPLPGPVSTSPIFRGTGGFRRTLDPAPVVVNPAAGVTAVSLGASKGAGGGAVRGYYPVQAAAPVAASAGASTAAIVGGGAVGLAVLGFIVKRILF